MATPFHFLAASPPTLESKITSAGPLPHFWLEFVKEAFDTNWIAPVGPNVDAFEQEFCQVVGARHAAAVSSGTAALHLALRLGVKLSRVGDNLA